MKDHDGIGEFSTPLKRSYIVYGSHIPPMNRTEGRIQVAPKLWIRIEVFEGDCSEALNMAKPETDESVLNTVDIPN